MYIVTDIAAVLAAAEAKAPRPVEEVYLERYPNAVIDKNNRAHAPHDGYVDAETGNVYRGGEYLPFPEADGESNYSGGGYVPRCFVRDIAAQADVAIEGTKAQVKAARDAAKAQQTAFDATRSHVGKVKDRSDFDLTIFAIFSDTSGLYGPQFTHYMRDADNNPVVYKGSKKIGQTGDTVKMKATVKAHWQADDGRVATYIARPKLV